LLLQPFEEFKPAYLNRVKLMGCRYLVSQTYHRLQENNGLPQTSKINLLFSDYIELGQARLHLNALKHDRYAAIIDLNNSAHLQKIHEMLSAGSPYRIFFAVIRSTKMLENLIDKQYKAKVKRYVEKQTDWRIAHDAVVKPRVELSFGELFIILKHGNQRIRIKFEDIER
jgi:hypothetical protein